MAASPLSLFILCLLATAPLVSARSNPLNAEQDGQSDVLEFHDEAEPDAQAGQQGNIDDYLKSLPEEERQKIFQQQQFRSTACILFTQIYANEFKQTISDIVSLYPTQSGSQAYDKVFATLMMHCFKTAKEEDLAAILDRAREGKFTLEGLVALSSLDLSPLQSANIEDLKLSGEEKQAVKILKDYEERARQQRMYGDEDRDIEGTRDKNRKEEKESSAEEVMIFGKTLNVDSWGTPFVLAVVGGVIAIFAWCKFIITSLQGAFPRQGHSLRAEEEGKD